MPQDFYRRIADLLRRSYSPAMYKELYCMLRLVCEEFCGDRVFSNFFSKLGYVCDNNGIPSELASGLQNLRRRLGFAGGSGEEDFRCDARLLTAFVQRLYGGVVPRELSELLPVVAPQESGRQTAVGEYKVLRVRVLAFDDTYIYAQRDIAGADGSPIRIDYVNGGIDSDLIYITGLLHKDSTLSLLKVRVDDNQVYIPRWIVYEPDYLMSPSELASVFDVHGASPENYLVKMFSPAPTTTHILLGNVSGVFLDDLLHAGDGRDAGYSQSVVRAFRKNPIDFSLTIQSRAEAQQFHSEARVQYENISRLFENRMSQTYGFDLDKALLEPSFVCPAVGLAGRMDFLQSDATRLIEQKSGKRDEYRNTHREPHFVQMMLYQMMIEYTVGIRREECQAYLLYSRYPDGLMQERPYVALLRKAIEMRNRIVCMAERCCEGGLPDIMRNINVDAMRTAKISDRLWNQYIAPRIRGVVDAFARTDGSMIHSYVCRFYSFMAREQWLSKMGSPAVGSHGYADLWNNPSLVRLENGDMYSGLKVRSVETGNGGLQTVVFEIPAEMCNIQTNFRLGDAVQIYSYQGNEPNVSAQFTLRGRLAVLEAGELHVVLSNPQRNLSVFADSGADFALEHDHVDSGNAILYRSLFGLLASDPAVWSRYLLASLPERVEPKPLAGQYGAFDSLVSKERAARDFFLVIGPPGSGKTSCAMRYMLEEELRTSKDGKILIMAYTNRAVDELCAMLEAVAEDTPSLLSDYLRIGHALSASPCYHGRMLEARTEAGLTKTADVRQMLMDMRVVVGTVSTISQQQLLLQNMQFDVAFVDEASQILEPYLLPIYIGGNVGRFVLVGDQKQLPAVVQQDFATSAISDSELNSIGIDNCAVSLFDRMLHRFMSRGRDDLYHQLQAQGRMHPEVFGFVNNHFYGNSLECVPLHHQKRSIAYLYPQKPAEKSALLDRLTTDRVLFLDCLPDGDDSLNDKVNSAEAEMAVDCIRSLMLLYEANGRELTPDDIGIIVPYRNQISMIRNSMQSHGLHHLLPMAIDTVERYQGSQRDVIIYTFTVRHLSQLAFLTSATYTENDNLYDSAYIVDRKLNVALTRAREQVILIGNKALLSKNPLFRQLIDRLAGKD